MIRYNTDCPYCHDIFDQYCNLFKGYKNCDKIDCEVLKILKENEQLQKNNKHIQELINAERQRQEECNDVHLRDIATLEQENEQLKIDLKLYKKALELFVNWADECDFGYDNLGDLKYEYKDEVESLKYQEGLIHIAVSEAKKELAE